MNLTGKLVLTAAFTGLSLLPAADPALLKLIPADAAFVAGIHADQIKNSRFGQYLLDQMRDQDDKLAKFIDRTGFDPRRDLSEIVIASNDARRHGKGLVIAKGRFDSSRIRNFASGEGADKTTYQGFDVITGKRGDDSQGWLTFLDSGTAVAGDMELVKAAIDRRKSNLALDPKVANRITDLGTRYDAWMMTTNTERLAGDVQNPQLKGALMQGMETVVGGVRFGANVELMAEATMRSEKDASALADVLRFVTGMVQLNRDNDAKTAEMAELLDKIDAKASGNQFRLTMNVPEDVIERIVKPASAPRHRRVI